jgi:hypothetical protein
LREITSSRKAVKLIAVSFNFARFRKAPNRQLYEHNAPRPLRCIFGWASNGITMRLLSTEYRICLSQEAVALRLHAQSNFLARADCRKMRLPIGARCVPSEGNRDSEVEAGRASRSARDGRISDLASSLVVSEFELLTSKVRTRS